MLKHVEVDIYSVRIELIFAERDYKTFSAIWIATQVFIAFLIKKNPSFVEWQQQKLNN